MNERESGSGDGHTAARLERRVNSLAAERSTLFDSASGTAGLSKKDQERLRSIERELDECFVARRRLRAETDARRFKPYGGFARATNGKGTV